MCHQLSIPQHTPSQTDILDLSALDDLIPPDRKPSSWLDAMSETRHPATRPLPPSPPADPSTAWLRMHDRLMALQRAAREALEFAERSDYDTLAADLEDILGDIDHATTEMTLAEYTADGKEAR